jgi:hypothetical protein
MRILALSVLTVAFLASVSAKFGFGNCARDIVTYTWEEYDDFFGGDLEIYEHEIAIIDKGFVDMIYFLENFGFKSPIDDWRCGDLVSISPFKEIAERIEQTDGFYYEEEDFNKFFLDREDSILKFITMRGYIDNAPTPLIGEVFYICFDL